MHPFDPAALFATVLNQILTVVAGVALLKPHRSVADDARNQRHKRAAVVIY